MKLLQTHIKKILPSLRSRIITSTLGALVFSIALCIVVLLLLIDNILSAYIQNDVDFAMKEISSNLSTKTVFLEDILLNLRDDEALMNTLHGSGLSNEDDSATQLALRRIVNIYSDKNTINLNAPFLDFVYLFDNWGVSNSCSYVDNLYTVQALLDRSYNELYQSFNKSGQDTSVILLDDRINIVYKVYDKQTRMVGTIIFAINAEAVRQMMQKTDQYQDYFWFVHDKHGKVILASDKLAPDSTQLAEVTARERTAPYDYQVGAVGYRVYSERANMGLGVTIGVASDQLALLLFDSVKYYLIVPILLLLTLGTALFFHIMRLTRPLSEVADSLQKVADENFNAKLPQYDSREFNTISDTFNSMTDTINHLVNDVYEKKLLVMDSELRFLQSQMNPHFMYNVLNTIALNAKLDGNEAVYKMASSFSGLTQARLYHKGDEKITVEQELQLVQFYLDLQKYRFEEKLSYHITVQEDELLKCRIPKLIVELIVENAVVHGIEPKAEPGTVYVDIASERGDLVIRIEDDGVGFEGESGIVTLPIAFNGAKEGHNHIALENASKIIHLFYGEEYGITIQSRQGIGTMVTICIPIDREGAADNVQSDGGGRRTDDAQGAEGAGRLEGAGL